MEIFKPDFGVFFLIAGGFLKDFGDLLESLFPRPRRVEGVLVPRLRLP
jgi:hypothetical protein